MAHIDECADPEVCHHEAQSKQGWREVRRARHWRQMKIVALYTVAGAIFLLAQLSLLNMELSGRWVITFCFGWVMGDMTVTARRLL